MRSLKYRTSAESFPWESVLIYRCMGGWGLGAGGKVVFGWNRMVFRGDEGDLSVLTAGGGEEGSSTI